MSRAKLNWRRAVTWFEKAFQRVSDSYVELRVHDQTVQTVRN